MLHLKTLPNGRGGTLRSGTMAHYLNSLSNLYLRAIEDGLIPRGGNPVAACTRRPTIICTPPLWLESAEVADVLEWARTFETARPDLTVPFLYEVLAGLALPGDLYFPVYDVDGRVLMVATSTRS